MGNELTRDQQEAINRLVQSFQTETLTAWKAKAERMERALRVIQVWASMQADDNEMCGIIERKCQEVLRGWGH